MMSYNHRVEVLRQAGLDAFLTRDFDGSQVIIISDTGRVYRRLDENLWRDMQKLGVLKAFYARTLAETLRGARKCATINERAMLCEK